MNQEKEKPWKKEKTGEEETRKRINQEKKKTGECENCKRRNQETQENRFLQ